VQRCGGAICKVNGASSYSLGSLSDITYDPNSDALRIRYVEVRENGLGRKRKTIAFLIQGLSFGPTACLLLFLVYFPTVLY
jgi:hypothetical protein